MKTFALRLLVLSTLTLGTIAPCAASSARAQDSATTQALPEDASSADSQGVPSDVWERIRRGFAIPMLNSPLVDKWVKYYTSHPEYLRRMTERAGQYLYHIVEEIENRGMPTELALLPFVESAFQPEALSVVKAAGLWQFMPATGNDYALTQNIWRDDRRDVLESTRAALDYFSYLHGLFGDWQLALAAYNWGEGSVQRAIRRAKAAKRPADYAHLRMPAETANYVPKLEAVKRIISDPAKYGIELPDVGNEPFFVAITKPRDIDLETAAKLADMSVRDFRALNPSYKLPVIVASHNNVMLLPADKVDTFIDNLASWMDGGQPLSQWTTTKLKPGETLAKVAARTGMTVDELRRVNGVPAGRNVLANSTLLVRANRQTETSDIAADLADARLVLSPATTWRRVTYRVRSGDTLSGIAQRWRISTKSIVTANRLRNDRLRAGQKLVLTVPNVQRAAAEQPRAQAPVARHVIYRVVSGDTLSEIAERYGTTVAALKATNRLKGNALKLGQRLRIPEKGVTQSDTRYYTVQVGDTLSEIAERFGVSVTRIQRANRLSSANLRAGLRLEIPDPLAKAAPARQAAKSRTHTVAAGDSLYTIAQRYNVTVDQLKNVNGLSRNTIRIGQTLVIPAESAQRAPAAAPAPGGVKRSAPSGREHVVRAGDSLYTIAQRYNVSVDSLKEANDLDRNTIRVGQTLSVPAAKKAATRTGASAKASARVHVVRAGDTLSTIALKYGTTVSALKRLNGLKGTALRAGERLRLP